MLTRALAFLLEVFLGLFALALLLRFYLQLLRAPPRNPLSTFLTALTDWLVVPARRVIPGLFRVDLSTLVLAWLTHLLLLSAKALLGVGKVRGLLLLALAAAVEVVKFSIYLLMVVVIAQVVLSWVAPYSPAMPVLNSLTRPFLLVFSKRIPPVGNVDLSPLFVIVCCQLALLLVSWATG